MGERFVIEREGCDLAGERWPWNAQLVVLLHEGVSDRRGWREVAQRLAPRVTAVAYESRVGGEARTLALEMNAIILRNGAREDAGGSGVDAWHRLDEIEVPVTVACGELDVPFLIARSREMAGRLRDGRYRQLPGMAHQ